MNKYYRYNFGFKFQKPCLGVCGGKTFITTNDNRIYCDDCRIKLNVSKWNKEEKKILIRGDK